MREDAEVGVDAGLIGGRDVGGCEGNISGTCSEDASLGGP